MVRSQPSFRLRQNAPQKRKDSHKDSHKKQLKNTQQKNNTKQETNSSGLFYPSGDTAFKLLLSARFCAAVWSYISDCDETYNYWEPMYYLIFGKGLQTWEYSPQYALRSYMYLLIHAAPAYIICQTILQPQPLLMFYYLRCLLAVVCAFSEAYFYKAVSREFGVNISRIWLAFELFSTGMFISSTAFLPSTFAMYTFTAACAAWWQQRYALAVFFTALGSLLGWPFAALLGLPIAFDMVFRQKLYFDFIIWSAISAVTILIPMVIVDSMYYGRLVVAPLNIIKYNVFGGAGPDLYGTEPVSYYLINGFLNFNFIWLLALFCPIAIILCYFFVPSKNKSTLSLPYWLSLSPFYLWLVVFMFQPHKEERFLFPIYPMICLCGAITLDIIQKLTFRLWNFIKKLPHGAHYLDYTMPITIIAITVIGVLSISRVVALYKNYHAPMDLFTEINKFPSENNISEKGEINFCLGKEWYRFQSSFFLPKQWNVRFIKSEFSGMLPAPYLNGPNATQIIPPYFNDQNKENSSLYYDVDKCHFLMDLDVGKDTPLEPNYSKMLDKWKIIISYPFLNWEKSDRLFRAFYIPKLTENNVVYGHFIFLCQKILEKKIMEKGFPLTKSSSTSDLTKKMVNLRLAKSCDAEYASFSVDPNKFQDNKKQSLELYFQDYKKPGIATKDVLTGKLLHLNDEIKCNGKIYTSKDIACCFKKDYRMWMWKNSKKYKNSLSVAENNR